MPNAMRVCIGMNAGEPIAEDGNLFGSASSWRRRWRRRPRAARFSSRTSSASSLSGKGFLFADLGDPELRGFEDRLYELKWDQE
jgi:hypothetical protein